MTELEERIAQFEKMAEADPENDMAHFSLGNAYFKARRFPEAGRSMMRCLQLNPEMSKAYQLAGQSLINSGAEKEAVKILKAGYEVSASKGDVMPQKAMAKLLESIGHEPPALPEAVKKRAEEVKESGSFICQRTGRPGNQLEDPPMRGPIGEWIQQNISAQTWQEWLGQGTKLINELRLDFGREKDQLLWERHMCEYLGIDDDLHQKLTAAKS